MAERKRGASAAHGLNGLPPPEAVQKTDDFAILLYMQKEHTYSLTIEPHEGGYLAYFPSLPGCNTWGTTYEEAVKCAEEALSLYLETLAEHGDVFPEETTHDPITLGVTVRTSIIV